MLGPGSSKPGITRRAGRHGSRVDGEEGHGAQVVHGGNERAGPVARAARPRNNGPA